MSLPHKNQIITSEKVYGTYRVMEVMTHTVFLSKVNKHNEEFGRFTEQELRVLGFTWEEEKWKPKYMDDYFFIHHSGHVWYEVWQDTNLDKARRDFLGVYPTREKAMEALREIKQKLYGEIKSI